MVLAIVILEAHDVFVLALTSPTVDLKSVVEGPQALEVTALVPVAQTASHQCDPWRRPVLGLRYHAGARGAPGGGGDAMTNSCGSGSGD